MDKFLDILYDSFLDTVKILPFLFLVYFLIEVLEYKNVLRFEKSRLLKGGASPVMGSLFGSVPQCGFSVVSAELFAEQKISIGALIAVFIATSDEALPIMLSNYASIPALVCLIAVKIVFAIIVGYITMFLYKKLFARKTTPDSAAAVDLDHDEHSHIKACCNHDLEDDKFDWKHPLIHCLKITLYIFLINFVFGLIIMFIGEDRLISFLNSSSIFQPLFAVIVGLIPNCASSVVLTELYLLGGLSFGSVVAGLSVNAGIGLIVLLKENKNKKENLFIVLSLIISSLVIGYALHYIPIKLF